MKRADDAQSRGHGLAFDHPEPHDTRKPLQTRGAVVAHQAFVHAGQAGALRGIAGDQLDQLKDALADAVDLALSPPDPAEKPTGRPRQA